MRAAILSLLFCLGACAEFPALDKRIDSAARDAPYPQLTNIAPLIAQANMPIPIENEVAQSIASRIATLNARANGLRGAIIESPVRARMQRGIDISALR